MAMAHIATCVQKGGPPSLCVATCGQDAGHGDSKRCATCGHESGGAWPCVARKGATLEWPHMARRRGGLCGHTWPGEGGE